MSSTLLKRGDLFDIVLIQIKSGSARGPMAIDCRRLLEVKRIYRGKLLAASGIRSILAVRKRASRRERVIEAEAMG